MKNLLPLLAMILVYAYSPAAVAQETVPKEMLLTTLNSVAHLKFENDQVEKLMEYNKGFVDEVYEVLESDKEEKHKKELLDAIGYKREIDLHEFLTKHETKKYLKYMEDELRPLYHKNKMLKHIAKY